MGNTIEIAKKWAQNPNFDTEFKQEIQDLIDKNETEELEDRFFQDVKFGTGGMRGIIGAGRNRINRYTIQKATQGYANYILKQNIESPSVAIAYDSRRKSKFFAEQTAGVFAANGIHAYLYPSLHPTPLLSYAILKLKTTVGIVITASHNPPEYNGYKVYWSDGYQVSTPRDKEIIAEVNAVEDFSKIRFMPFEDALENKLAEYIPESLDKQYMDELEQETYGNISDHENFHFLYSPLHGTGRELIKKMMMRRGFTNFRMVPSQEFPDENFSTVKSPNPEDPGAYNESIEFADPEDQIILATDPDADRLGAMVRDGENWRRLNGNEIGILLLDYKLRQLKKQNRMPENGFIISTVVTSELFKKVAEHFGMEFHETLTGFKYIAKKTDDLIREGKTFIFACEESHGYQIQTFIREKDGVSAALFFAEMAAECHARGVSIPERLNEIYQEQGYHTDSLINIRLPGISGTDEIKKITESLRKNPIRELIGIQISAIKDYQAQTITYGNGEKEKLEGFPEENLLAFYFEDGSRISIRPSGTEPLIKYYFNLCDNKDRDSLLTKKEKMIAEFNQIIEAIRAS